MNNYLFVQIYDLDGNKKCDIIHVPYQQANYVKLDFMPEYNLLVFFI